MGGCGWCEMGGRGGSWCAMKGRDGNRGWVGLDRAMPWKLVVTLLLMKFAKDNYKQVVVDYRQGSTCIYP